MAGYNNKLETAGTLLLYYVYRMKKYLKIIKKLTKKVGASLALLKNGIKNLFVIGAIDKVGLITILDSKSARCPLNLELNFPIISEAKI